MWHKSSPLLRDVENSERLDGRDGRRHSPGIALVASVALIDPYFLGPSWPTIRYCQSRMLLNTMHARRRV